MFVCMGVYMVVVFGGEVIVWKYLFGDKELVVVVCMMFKFFVFMDW